MGKNIEEVQAVNELDTSRKGSVFEYYLSEKVADLRIEQEKQKVKVDNLETNVNKLAASIDELSKITYSLQTSEKWSRYFLIAIISYILVANILSVIIKFRS